MSRLLESFAADEGFQMDGSSFSEEEGEESSNSYDKKVPQRERRSCCAFWMKWKIVPSFVMFFILVSVQFPTAC